MKNVRSLDAVPKFSHELQSEHIYFKQGFGYEHLQKYLDQRSYIIDLQTILYVCSNNICECLLYK